jgi:UDP-glucose 4-epimerase
MFSKRYKHVLVTGGAGFIGSHLTEALLNEGCAVTIVDDLSTGRWENISHLEGLEGFRAIISSADDRDLLAAEMPRHDFVFHLASAVGVRNIVEHPVHTVQSIFGPTEAVLHFCARYRRPFLLTSTSEVYGKSEAIPFREESDTVMGPTEKRRWAYACAKALDEFLALAYHHETRLPVYVVRLFNTVGRRQTGQYGMVLPSFVKRALAGEALLVHGDGEQQRCFCSVLDIVQGLLRVALCKEAVGRVVNLGSQDEVSMKALARRVVELTNSKSEIRIVPYSEVYGEGFDDMRRRVPDLGRAKALVDWAPRYGLDDIIRQVIDGTQGG